MKKVLIVDGERAIRNTLKERLEYENYHVDVASNGDEAMYKIGHNPFDVVLYDITLPNLQVTELIRNNNKSRFIAVSSQNDINEAIASMRYGAHDYISKPIDLNKLLSSMRTLLDGHSQNHATNVVVTDELHEKSCDCHDTVAVTTPCDPADDAETRVRSTAGMRRHICVVDKIIGESIAISHVKNLIDKVGPSEARVLVTGDSGTGKELVARWLHEKSRRSAGPFVEVNCAAIPSELIESELFGHEKGAFTSAIKQRKGKFEQADGGTLFLDEIGDMSLSAQAKVLRALQEHKICRVGSDKDIEVNVRIVAATNKNLQHEIAAATFREDLYHRLSVIVIRLPALRERREDISLLIGHFIGRICSEYNIERKKIEPSAIEALMGLEWTGNIRELGNVIERLIILSGKVITLKDVNMYVVETIEA